MQILDRYFLPKCNKNNSVHAATIEKWKNHFVFSWFEGTKEGNPDVFISLYNLNNEKDKILLGNKDSIPRWNPILFKSSDNLYLFEKAGEFCDRWQTFIHNISDWTPDMLQKEMNAKSQILPCGLNGPVKTRPVTAFIGGNEIIHCGSSFETFCNWTSYIESYRIINGMWRYISRSNPICSKERALYKDRNSGAIKCSLGIIQPSLWIEDNIRMTLRPSNGLNYIYTAEQEEIGKETGIINIGNVIRTKIPNPNSSVCSITCGDFLYLACNPSEENRFPLVIYKIGKINNKFELEKIEDTLMVRERNVDGLNFPSGFSYPYMIEDEGKIHLVYTYERREIEYLVIDTK